jgi:hypothetical protein
LPYNINQEGAIAGNYTDASGVSHCFLRSPGGTFTTFNAPGAGTNSGQGTFTAGTIALNLTYAITGVYLDAGNAFHGYVRAPDGTIAGTSSGQGTSSESINLEEAITGQYIDSSGVNHGFLRTPFGAITTFDAPGAGTMAGQGTIAETNNDLGAIIGYDIDDNGVNHGFLRNP